MEFYGPFYPTRIQWRTRSQWGKWIRLCGSIDGIEKLFSIKLKMDHYHFYHLEKNINCSLRRFRTALTCTSLFMSWWFVRLSHMSAVKLWLAKHAFLTNNSCSTTDVSWNANMYKNIVGSTVMCRYHDRRSVLSAASILSGKCKINTNFRRSEWGTHV